MTWTRLLLLTLVVALSLPAGLLESAPGRGLEAGPAPSLAMPAGPAANPAEADAPLLKKGDTKKKPGADRDTRETRADKKRKTDARERNGQDRRDRKPPTPPRDGARDQTQTRVEPTRRDLAELLEEPCDGPGQIYLPRSGLCTHGPDPAPPGVDPTRRALPLPAARTRVSAEALTCDGNGQSGPRVQVLYAHASNVPSRFDTYLPSFRTWTAGADEIMQESAAASGGSLRFRFVTIPGCQLDVQEVTLSPTGDDTFDNTIVELKAQGFTRSDRYYLVFVDTVSAGICGIATGKGDDGPGQANWNNYGAGFSRVDAGCWNAPTAAHELMHNLGAVNDSAPNTSLAGHCIDDYDIMCYSDPPFFPKMRIDCPDIDFEFRYDCGSDDYFNPNPPPGSYLATHWNTANNRFLVGGGNGGDDDGVPPVVTWVSPTGNDATHEAAAGTLNLQVTATDGSGINRVRFWRYNSETDTAIELATDRDVPYTATLSVSDLAPGYNSVWVVATDGARAFTVESIGIRRTEQNPEPPTLTWTSPVGNGETHRAASGTVTLEVAASDPAGIDSVEFGRYDSVAEEWVELGVDESAPYRASLDIADLRFGDNYVLAEAYDLYGNRAFEEIWVERSEPNPGPPELTWTAPVGNGETHRASRGAISLDVDASDPSGIAVVEFARYDDASDQWVELAADESAPYRTSLAVADLRLGDNYVLAEAFDPFNNFTAKHIWIERTEPADPVVITSPQNGAKVKAGANVTVSAAVNDASGAVTVEFRSCGGGSCTWGAASPIGTDQSAPYSASWKAPKAGTFTFLAQVTDDDGSEVSDPVTVSVQKAKKKKKKKR